ncbi:hypothetical protein QCA50_019347 [Cerrena zonata]|uniref:Uncharacterized protein n=1 Tax=Cerrena zonata TaxID=2478898 RepID=A0AAW0FJZ9_9APHY
MAQPTNPAWSASFEHVHWTEHCVVRSNSARPAAFPPGSGVDLRETELFHLSLLTTRLWGQDNFWYLAMLPRYPSFARDPLFKPLAASFDDLPIEQTDSGKYLLRRSLARVWSQLELHMIQTYNILRAKYLPYVPLNTVVPPYPRTSGFTELHSSELVARKAAHRTRRLFLAWMCLISFAIRASRPKDDVRPPSWFMALADASPALPPFWIDNIMNSPILAFFGPQVPRRGMVINMSREWGFFALIDILATACIPIWLCFPHGLVPTTKLAKLLYPPRSLISTARETFLRANQIEVDDIDDVNDHRDDVPPHLDLPHLQHHRNSPISTPNDHTTAPITSARAHDSSCVPAMEGSDALSTFFRKRRGKNDGRDLASYGPVVLNRMRARGITLQESSTVYEWESIDVPPWFVRVRVGKWDQARVWESYAVTQRVYDEYEDQWDCWTEFAPMDSVYCSTVGCRDETHDHEHVYVSGSIALAQLALADDGGQCYCQDTDMGEGEWTALTFSREEIDPFLDILKYRYGLRVSYGAPGQNIDFDNTRSTPLLLDALRALVHEEVLTDSTWRSREVISAIVVFYQHVECHGPIPASVSDCHVNDADFLAANNRWGLSVVALSTQHRSKRLYGLCTLNDRSLGWMIAVNSRLSLREVFRRGWGPGNLQLWRCLMERGMQFNIVWTKLKLQLSTTNLSHEVPYREEAYRFTPEDYKAYVHRRLQLLKDPRVAGAALRHGGIVWRLAMESNIPTECGVVPELDAKVFDWEWAHTAEATMVTCRLSVDVLDAIVGVYKAKANKQLTPLGGQKIIHGLPAACIVGIGLCNAKNGFAGVETPSSEGGLFRVNPEIGKVRCVCEYPALAIYCAGWRKALTLVLVRVTDNSMCTGLKLWLGTASPHPPYM